MEERRKHARFRSSTIVQYKNSIFAAKVDTLTKDVSLGGVCFFSQGPLKVGQKVNVKLFYEPRSSGKMMRGRVAWSKECRDQAGKGYLNGLTFIR